MAFLRRNAHRVVVKFPSALLLAVGYSYTALILGFKVNVPPGSGVQRVASDFSVFCVVFALWHFAGYFGYVGDRARKFGYLASAVFLAGFATVLYADRVMLGGGYVALGCIVALFSYWKYPRRGEA